jgi:putative NADH-flavin reductase
MDPTAILDSMRDQDAVISAIGTRNGRKPTTVCTDSARSIVRAMHDAGTKRLVVVSGTGPFKEGEGIPMRFLIKPLGQLFLRNVFGDFVTMEEVIRASGLDWTIIRPPSLNDKPFTGIPHARDENMHGTSRCRGPTSPI